MLFTKEELKKMRLLSFENTIKFIRTKVNLSYAPEIYEEFLEIIEYLLIPDIDEKTGKESDYWNMLRTRYLNQNTGESGIYAVIHWIESIYLNRKEK